MTAFSSVAPFLRLAVCLCFLSVLGFAADSDPKSFNIPAGSAEKSLRLYSAQSGLQVIFPTEIVKGIETNEVKGDLPPPVALDRLLSGTPLVAVREGNKGALTVRRESSVEKAEKNGSSRPAGDRAASGYETNAHGEKVLKLETFEVMGSKLLNMDLPRTRDDAQPYVVFDREVMDNSSATNLEEFLKTRLPMNARSQDFGQAIGSATPFSSIDLRGLGDNQTLILVDGRRIPSISNNGTISQPNLNGIPLSAIERVEVLPSTAGGIYGGSANGGVINIVLRRGYHGAEVRVSYSETFHSSAARKQVGFNAGLNLEGGRTSVMLVGAWSDAGRLVVGDRDFAARAIALTMKNNPAAITGLATPPIGATANIRAVSGNLVLDPAYGGAALNSNITFIPLGYAGAASDNGAALLANAGKYNLELSNDLNGKKRGLVAAPSIKSVSASVRRRFSDRLEAFVDLSRYQNNTVSYSASVPNVATNLPAAAPNNPFQQAITVRFPTPGLNYEATGESVTERVLGGVILRLPKEWMAGLDYSWSRSRWINIGTSTAVSTAATTVLNSGLPHPDGRTALDALQDQNTHPLDFSPYFLPSPNFISGPTLATLSDLNLRLSGPIVRTWAGPVVISSYAERRTEKLPESPLHRVDTTTGAPLDFIYPLRSQSVDSLYLETRVPLIAPVDKKSRDSRLEVQGSLRYDRYSTRSDGSSIYAVPLPMLNYTTRTFDSINYTLGVRGSPVKDLTLRASISTGFLPPTVVQIASSQTPISFSLGNDPFRGGTGTYVGVPYRRITGGSSRLKPETSRGFSAGAIFTPRFLPNFRLSIDYTRTKKTDEIQLPDPQFILDRQDVFSDRIVRGPNLPTDLPGWAGPITSFDQTLLNVAGTEVEAWDFQADYKLKLSPSDNIRCYAVGTWQPHYKNQLRPDVAVIDRIGFTGGPLERRGNLGVDWTRGRLTVRWNVQFYDSYYVYTATSTAGQIATAVLNQGAAKIPSQSYHDLSISYRFTKPAGWVGRLLADTEITVGVQNLLDKSPPIVAATTTGSLGYSAYGDPRLGRYSLSIRKSFN